MAGSSFFKRVRKVSGKLAIIIPILALSGCGEGDGPTRILGTAATPLPSDFVPTLGVFSETNTDPVVSIIDIQFAGDEVVISTETERVFDGAVSLGLRFTTGGQGFGGASILFEDADVSPYNTLKFSIDTSSIANFANLTVQLQPPAGGTPGGNVALADYTPAATSGTWNTYEIPLADFTALDPSVVNVLGFFSPRDGSGTLLAGTLYLDDIHFTVTDVGGPGATGTPIDPEIVLYATEGNPDLIIPDDYDDVTGLESGSVPNLFYADDDTYSKVLSVFSGTIDDTIVAQVGFIGFDPGFVTFYEDLIFKVKGMPNFVVFVTLYEGGDPVRINLTSSDYSEALDNGWFQVSIPLSIFTGLTSATGIVFESDDTAAMQFRMLLTDIGFSVADDGGNGGGPFDDGLLTNGDFEAGTSPWLLGTSASIGAENVIDDNGNNVFFVDVTAAGNPFDVNLSQKLAITPGETYTLTFKARSNVPRSMLAGIGQSADPFYSATQTVNLTTTWQTFEIEVTATDDNGGGDFGDSDSRVLFDMGAEISEVYIDDVSLVVSTGGTGGGGNGVEIAVNGGFESGDFTGWTQFEATPGDQTVNMGMAGDSSSEGAFHLEINNAATDTNSLIKQERVGLGVVTPGVAWTVTFDARGSVVGGGVAFAQVFSETAGGNENCDGCGILGGAPLALNGDPTVWTSFSFSGTAGPTTESLTLQLEAVAGAGSANVFYDNISIVIN